MATFAGHKSVKSTEPSHHPPAAARTLRPCWDSLGHRADALRTYFPTGACTQQHKGAPALAAETLRGRAGTSPGAPVLRPAGLGSETHANKTIQPLKRTH